MDRFPSSRGLKLTQAMFFINALTWFIFGVLSMILALKTGTPTRWVITLLMIANAGGMFWFGLMISGRRNRIFFLAILFVSLNVVFTITDQFGWIDALILLLNLCLLGLLFVTRKRLDTIEGAQ